MQRELRKSDAGECQCDGGSEEQRRRLQAHSHVYCLFVYLFVYCLFNGWLLVRRMQCTCREPVCLSVWLPICLPVCLCIQTTFSPSCLQVLRSQQRTDADLRPLPQILLGVEDAAFIKKALCLMCEGLKREMSRSEQRALK